MPSLDTDDDALLLTERHTPPPPPAGGRPVHDGAELGSEVVRYTGDTAFACEDEARAVVARLARQFEDFRMGRLIISDRTTEEKLGWCGLRWHDDLEGRGLRYRFFRKHWGRGYATESAAACIRYAVEELRLPRLVAPRCSRMPRRSGAGEARILPDRPDRVQGARGRRVRAPPEGLNRRRSRALRPASPAACGRQRRRTGVVDRAPATRRPCEWG